MYFCPWKTVLIGKPSSQKVAPFLLLSHSRFYSCIYPIKRKAVFDSEVDFSGKLAAGLSQQVGDMDIKFNIERFLMLKLSKLQMWNV